MWVVVADQGEGVAAGHGDGGMKPEAMIGDMRRRIRAWLPAEETGTGTDGDTTLEALESDLAALEDRLQALLPEHETSGGIPDPVREQAVLRTVLESMAEGVVVSDMDGRMLVFNAAARAMLGRGPADANSGDWSAEFGLFRADASTPYPAEELPLTRSLAGESVDDDELVVRTPAHPDDRVIQATSRPVSNDDGTQLGAVVVFHDVTATKALESELRQAREVAEDNVRAKSAFLANMSHEIRTPLTAVIGFADLLLDRGLGESERLNYIQAVRRNGEHLLALVNDVLDVSRINADQIQTEFIDCSLHHILHEVASVMRMRAYEKGIAFDVTYETPIPATIQSDPMRLRQILLNLVSNAVKFTQSGGVGLTARCLDAGTDRARVEMDVTDSGIGLSAEEIDGLFQPFQQANPSTTRQYGGTGLGLTICRSLAELLGGEIRVDSTPGEGSTFTFVLYSPVGEQDAMVAAPCGDDVETGGDTATTEPKASLAGRVLLAEDGPDNQVLIKTILRRQGLEVEIVDNGESAVTRALEAARDGSALFDVILMDMQMPKLDGYGATSKLRANGYSGPIIALTAHAMSGERQRCMAAGCDDYLSKPIERPVLLAAVESHLHRVRGGQPDMATAPPADQGDHRSEEPTPLYSSYADDPDMDELVAGFVERLPLQIHDIETAADDGDLDLLRRLAHQLKGAAGGYGFMPISRAAEALEAAAREADEVGNAADELGELVSICKRVRNRGGGGVEGD